jgi:large subunit ribosomal protein L21
MPTYAIIETGGKQYRVTPGDVIDVDKLADTALGDTIGIEKVLMVSQDGQITVGKPYVQGATVKARVVGEPRSKKVRVFKFKPKVRYRRMKGHRTQHSRLEIQEITR